MIRLRCFWVLTLVGLLLLIGCQSPPAAVVVAQSPQQARVWQPLFVGIDYRFIETDDPRPLRIHAARVDLTMPGIGFVVTPPDPNAQPPFETRSQTTTAFLAEHQCQLAINASPFSPVVLMPGQPQRVVGLSANAGAVYSPPHDQFGAFWIDHDGRAHVAAPPIPVDQIAYGVGGFHMLLVDGKIVTTDHQTLHPRTAIGVADAGRTLIILVIDGRQPDDSEGVTPVELAQWMIQLGATSALNLDGGGSTTLVIADDNQKPRLINRPIHGNLIPGIQRPNANHLGIYAQPLPQ